MLDDVTARLQRGETIDPVLAQSDDAQGDLEDIAAIVQTLQASLAPLSPSQPFADGLRAELLAGRPGAGRLRQVPARLSLAAILAVFAGCVLFMLRRIFGSEAPPDIQEEAVATPL